MLSAVSHTWNGITLSRRGANRLEALLSKTQVLAVLRLCLSHSSMHNTCSQVETHQIEDKAATSQGTKKQGPEV